MTVPPEVTEYINSFMGRSPATKENYTGFARVFWDYVGDKPAKDVTVEQTMAFLNNGKDRWKPSTLKQYATLCQIFLTEFHDEAFKRQLRKQLKQLPRVQNYSALLEGIYIPPDKIDPFIANAQNEEYAVLYTMILKWGLRLGEALRVCPADVDPSENRVTVKGKGFGGFGKIRRVLVEKSTITRVLKFAGCSQEQINGDKQIRSATPILRTIKDRKAEIEWKHTCKKTGLKHWQKLTPHDGRHSYAIDFLIKRKKQGMMALVLLKNQLGHTSITTTQIYLDIAGIEAQDIFDAGVQNSNTHASSSSGVTA